MIDLKILRARVKAVPDEEGLIPVTRRCLEQIVAELEAGRAADPRIGEVFGLGKGITL